MNMAPVMCPNFNLAKRSIYWCGISTKPLGRGSGKTWAFLLKVPISRYYKNPILTEESLDQLHRYEEVSWQTAISFKMGERRATGLTTGSRRKIVRSEAVESPGREPVTNTPKMSLISELPIEGKEESLIVVNIHALNFVLPFQFRKQLEDLYERLKDHKGPMVLAGDLNTHILRKQILDRFVEKLGMKRVQFDDDNRWMVLDHIFVRDLEWSGAQVLGQVSSSDHKPLKVRLKIPH